MLEVLHLSENSLSFVERTKGLFGESHASVDVTIYSLTHDGLTQALIAANAKKDVIVSVIVDNCQMHFNGSTVKKLLKHNVQVMVHTTRTFMLHDKWAVFGCRIIVHSSVNWTKHVLASSRLLTIQHDEHLVILVLASFEKMLQSYRRVKLREVRKICKWCESYQVASAHRAAWKHKRRAKRAAREQKKLEKKQ